ncbi:MAG: hypothetical protein V7L09_17050 [Nostoc sp.]|uniref:hypothetical protein n=1 Tax=Nostoc sp. TaxID=1180 RepID=UPI002FF38A98
MFISQGKWDTVSPIKQYSPPIVQELRHAGYDVQYHEFNGLHIVPSAIAQKAMKWFTQPIPSAN